METKVLGASREKRGREPGQYPRWELQVRGGAHRKHEEHSCLLDLFPVLTDALEGSTGKKILIAKGVKNGKGTQRAVTTLGLCGLVGSRERVFLACGSREQREIRKGKLSI